MVIKDLVPVEWSSQRVLLTAQLAEAYKCSPKNISDNFNRAKEYFKEGVHYFCLTGTELEQFRLCSEKIGIQILRSEKIGMQISAKTRKLYLWTYQGCVRHCKMINTTKAWEVFDELEEFYFSQNTPKAIAAPAAKEKPAINPRRREGQLSDARVYVFLMSDGSVMIVKIGQSKNVNARKASVERETKLTVKKVYYTPLMSRKIVRLIERACHEIFSSSKLNGEFFSVEFDEACKVVDSFVKVVACLQVSDFERGDKLLSVAKVMNDSPERQKLLVSSAKLIAGRKFD